MNDQTKRLITELERIVEAWVKAPSTRESDQLFGQLQLVTRLLGESVQQDDAAFAAFDAHQTKLEREAKEGTK